VLEYLGWRAILDACGIENDAKGLQHTSSHPVGIKRPLLDDNVSESDKYLRCLLDPLVANSGKQTQGHDEI